MSSSGYQYVPHAALAGVPDFSILHATIRLPVGWHKAADAWISNCTTPQALEYILCLDNEDMCHAPDATKFLKESDASRFRVVSNDGRRCAVDAFNAAARASTGRVLLVVSDDYFPPEEWDEKLWAVLPDASREAVVQVTCGPFTEHIFIQPIITRTYYERPGRGGCNGELFYPGYRSMGADDDFTMIARRDGVVINGMNIVCEHRHPWSGNTEFDTHGAYRHNQSDEAWHLKETVLPRRIAENFAS